ncbi:MAG: HypC/HybG/HupF family hydrogenase formation chaperone [Magnetovibrio sp.]|nr:HypC/HybG/HupF family hydrogenase formation chaperone [Magnetovibrio sp.]
MCLAIPARVKKLLDDDMAQVDLDGVLKEVSIALTPEVTVGEYIIIHVGYALSIIDAEEAEKTLALFGDMNAKGAPAEASS